MQAANTQDALVGLWREIERQGKNPTISMVCKAARLIGHRFRTDDAYKLLSKFRERSGVNPGTTPEHSGKENPSHGKKAEQLGNNSGTTRERSTRARSKGTPRSLSLLPGDDGRPSFDELAKTERTDDLKAKMAALGLNSRQRKKLLTLNQSDRLEKWVAWAEHPPSWANSPAGVLLARMQAGEDPEAPETPSRDEPQDSRFDVRTCAA